jgi:hypothetical protein
MSQQPLSHHYDGTTTIYKITFVMFVVVRGDTPVLSSFSLASSLLIMMRLECFLSQQTNRCLLQSKFASTHQLTNMPQPNPTNSPRPPTTSIIELDNPSVDDTSLSTQKDYLSPSFDSIPPLAQKIDNDSPAPSVVASILPLAQMMDDESSRTLRTISLLLMTLQPTRPLLKVTTKTTRSQRPS